MQILSATQFDYPSIEELTEVREDGRAYLVQYVERVRFEHHPENAPPDDVLLGEFGRRILGNRQRQSRAPMAA